MSRSVFNLFRTLKFGIASRQFPKMVIGTKPCNYDVSSFYTCCSFAQKQQQNEKHRDTNDKDEEEKHSPRFSQDEKLSEKSAQEEEHSNRSADEEKHSHSSSEEENQEKKDKDEQTDDESKFHEAFSSSLVKVDAFDRAKTKNKLAFHDMVDIFNRQNSQWEHIDFIYSALKNMKKFGVEKDLQTYKMLIDVMPKGRFVPRNFIQAEFQHFPKHQQCIIDLLQQMEDNGVIPDWEMETMLVNIFGKRGHPCRRYWRMMYWMPKFKNLSPWPLPNPVPQDVLELAKLAITRIMSVDVRSVITVFQTKEIESSIDDTWVVTGQSPVQKKLLDFHSVDKPIFVEGGFRINLRDTPMLYFILRADPDPTRKIPVRDDDEADNVSELRIPFLTTAGSTGNDAVVNIPTVHEQIDGTIFAVCATGTSSKDSLLSWIRWLEKNGNPKLGKVPVLFTFKSPIGATVSIEEEEEEETKQVEQEKPLINS